MILGEQRTARSVLGICTTAGISAGAAILEWRRSRRCAEHLQLLEHHVAVIELMARDIEADDQRHQSEMRQLRQALDDARAERLAAEEQALLRGVSEATVAAHAERELLIERHQAELADLRRRYQIEVAEAARKGEARGYVDGTRQRLSGPGRSLGVRTNGPDTSRG